MSAWWRTSATPNTPSPDRPVHPAVGEGAGHHRRAAGLSHRWILVHVIEEYARRNGHADLLRERLDGE
ncbi:DUF664 domain-containing protein [Streptosporangium sp. NPDC001559]|uniref:mycothiol transferase n=1 Tax=Streptosporangium sp. NPDC001559 TaxID=3366187 RepID=UPI0036E36C53